jgi:voltage-gated potassium channel
MTPDGAERLFNFDSRLGRTIEAASAVVVVVSLAVLVALTEAGEQTTAHSWLQRADNVIWVAFCAEYAARLVSARRPLRYVRSFYGIVDLLAALSGIPAVSFLQTAKALRILRAVRLLKLARYSSAVDRFSEAFDDIKDELALYTGATAVLAFVSAYGIWQFEHEANEAYGNMFECVFWAVASLTMGAEGMAPSTTGGKILAMALVLIGLGIVAVPSGLLASALSKTDRLRDGP